MAKYSERAESGETLPKGVKDGDVTGEKKVRASKVDTTPEKSVTGAKAPKGADSSDKSGERKAVIAGGVGMGKMDGIGERDGSHLGKHDGRLGEMKGKVTEKHVYDHKRG